MERVSTETDTAGTGRCRTVPIVGFPISSASVRARHSKQTGRSRPKFLSVCSKIRTCAESSTGNTVSGWWTLRSCSAIWCELRCAHVCSMGDRASDCQAVTSLHYTRLAADCQTLMMPEILDSDFQPSTIGLQCFNTGFLFPLIGCIGALQDANWIVFKKLS